MGEPPCKRSTASLLLLVERGEHPGKPARAMLIPGLRSPGLLKVQLGLSAPPLLRARSVPTAIDLASSAAGLGDPAPATGVDAALAGYIARCAAQHGGRHRWSVLLSSSICRFVEVPWSEDLLHPSHELPYLQSCFASVYGGAASQWEVVHSEGSPGKPRLGAAVPTSVLQALDRLCGESSVMAEQIAPLVTVVYSELRKQLAGRSGALAVIESDALGIVRWDDFSVRSVDVMTSRTSLHDQLHIWLSRHTLAGTAPQQLYAVLLGGHVGAASGELATIGAWQPLALPAGTLDCLDQAYSTGNHE
jgi:hypothetical protein